MLYDSVPNVLSDLIRTAFVAREGNEFAVADFSAIEARVLFYYEKSKVYSKETRKAGRI